MCFSSCKNRKLEVKLWWVGVRERKKRAFFVPFILCEGKFFKICVLSQCILYWIHFQKIHTFTYQKIIIHTLLLLVFKIVESLQCILNKFALLKSWIRTRSWIFHISPQERGSARFLEKRKFFSSFHFGYCSFKHCVDFAALVAFNIRNSVWFSSRHLPAQS